MNRSRRRAAARAKSARKTSTARRLAAGLTATVAAGGLAAASASADTTILACYDNASFALSYLKPPATACPGGSTKISWIQTGPQGPQGARGAQGAHGAQGAKGAQGAQGRLGAQGPQGTQGKAGSQGAQGAKGAQGAPGVKGAQGTQGRTGPQGAQGAQGAQGSQGASPTGKAGAQGPQGAPGAQGAQGAEGAVGALPGYYAYATSAREFPRSASTVVASLKPASTGDFQVHALATLGLDSGVTAQCWVDTQSPSGAGFSPTPVAQDREHVSRTIPFVETGEMFAFSYSVIREVCRTSGGASSVNVQQTALVATRLQGSTMVSSAEARSGAARARRLEHTFSGSRASKLGGASK